MTKIHGLKCKQCGLLTTVALQNACTSCFGPLEVVYDLDRIVTFPGEISNGPESIWKWQDLLPVEHPRNQVDYHVGSTPLKHATKLGELLGLNRLYLKDDTVNPTGSFKDRPASVAVSKAKEFGLTTVGCASTGNLAAATASAAARAELPCYIFVPSNLDPVKLKTAQVYGGRIVPLDQTYDQVNRLANLVADEFDWGIVNVNVRPFYTEGSKTITFETVEQLGWQLPDHIITPLGSGALYTTIDKALQELRYLGWVEDEQVKINGSQPQGCSPIVTAFETDEEIRPVRRPSSIIKSLAIGDPASGRETLKILKKTGGWADAPTDEEVVSAQLELARTEGIFAEGAGGTVIASLKRKINQGLIDRDELVVAYITGSGYKTFSTLSNFLPPISEPLDHQLTPQKLVEVVS